jgi:predicted deacylase
MIAVAIDIREVPPGTVLRVRKRFGVTADGNDATYPLVVVAGPAPGPVVALVAGIHGDEYEGPAALRRVLDQLNPARVRGRVVVVPVAHTAAFAAGTRVSPIDGLNLARCFPGDANGTITLRLAHDLFETIACPADILVDLHSGGVRYAFASVAGFYDGDGIAAETAAQSLRLACSMRLEWLWRLPPRAGVLSFEAARRSVAVTGCEAGGRGGCLESDVDAYVAGLLNVLAESGVIDQPLAAQLPPVQIRALDGDFTLSPTAGFITPLVPLGARVTAGTLLARLHSCEGHELFTFRAEVDGVVMAERHLRAIQPGEWATCALRELAL